MYMHEMRAGHLAWRKTGVMTMRILAVALLVAAPSLALAQTPRDLARLTWGGAVPAATQSAAPVAGTAVGGAGAHDVARLVWPAGEPVASGKAPAVADVASGATGADLARLVGSVQERNAELEASVPAAAARHGRPNG
jgi:hypothetical protein